MLEKAGDHPEGDIVTPNGTSALRHMVANLRPVAANPQFPRLALLRLRLNVSPAGYLIISSRATRYCFTYTLALWYSHLRWVG